MIVSQTTSKSESPDYSKFHHVKDDDKKFSKIAKVAEDVIMIYGSLGYEYWLDGYNHTGDESTLPIFGT